MPSLCVRGGARWLALPLMLGAGGAAWAQTWRELGPFQATGASYPFTGRVSAVACSRTNPNLYYCAGADGGVWKSTEAGAAWIPVTDQQATTAIGALAIDPTNEEIVYAGTGEANFANHSRYGLGLLKSVDGGAHWDMLAPGTFAGRCISRIVIDPSSPSTLYACVTRAGGFPAPAAAKGHPLANGPRGVFKSSDGGVTWAHLGGGASGLPQMDATDLVMSPTAPSTLYAAIGFIFGDSANGVYRSTNSGATWAKLAGGLPALPGRIALAIAPTDAQRLYSLIASPADSAGGGASTLGAYRSDNGGATWTGLGIGSIQSSYGWYLCTVGVSPTNSSVVYAAGLALYRSTNAGGSWTQMAIPHVDCHDIRFDAGARPLIGCDGGLFRIDGSSFTSLNAGLGLIQFYAGLSTHATDDTIIIGGTQDNGTLRRFSAVEGWEHVVGGDGGWTQFDQRAPNIAYAESQGTGAFNKSTDDGESFSYSGDGISGRNCFLPPFLIDPADHNRLVYATERVWESLNGAATWRPLSPDLTAGGGAAIRAMAIAPSDSRYVYAATNDGRVLASTDAASSFTVIVQNNPGWPRVTREILVDPRDARTVYLAVANFGVTQVRRSRDAGQSWESLDGTLPDVPVNVLAIDTRYPVARLYAGTDAGVYASGDDGRTWGVFSTPDDPLPNACVVDLLLEPERGRLIAATQGRGAWTTKVFCPADIDHDGFVAGTDFDTFVDDFFAGGGIADFNIDGFVTGDDFDAFVITFEIGC